VRELERLGNRKREAHGRSMIREKRSMKESQRRGAKKREAAVSHPFFSPHSHSPENTLETAAILALLQALAEHRCSLNSLRRRAASALLPSPEWRGS